LSRESNKLVQGADAVRVAEGDKQSSWFTRPESLALVF
jgi:hypothetical protein